MNTPQQHRQTTFSHPALCHLKSSEVVFCAVIFRALSGPAHLLQNCIVLQVWVSHLWGHCSFLLGPRCAQGSVCALQDSVSQPCVSSGGSTVGLMATSSRRAYAIGETMETVTDFILGGSKITSDSDCSHEIKRCLLLGRKVMTN